MRLSDSLQVLRPSYSSRCCSRCTTSSFIFFWFRLVLKNTLLAPLISFLSFISPLISSLCILLTLYYHLHPPSAPPTTALLPSPAHLLVNVLPYLYAAVLRWVSPLFTLLEGISTLLVIQVAGRVGKGWADEEEREEGVEWRVSVGLVAAALVYSAGLAGVVMVSGTHCSYPSNVTKSNAPPEPGDRTDGTVSCRGHVRQTKR